MTEYGFLQVLQALSYFKCVSGPTGFRGSTFRAFEGLFEEVAGCDEAVCDEAVCDVADGIGETVCWTVCWAAAYVEAKLCGQCFHVLSQCDECDDKSVTS